MQGNDPALLLASLATLLAAIVPLDGWRIVPPGGNGRPCADPVEEGSALWVGADDLAGALGTSLKVVPPNGPAVFCRAENCVPLPLDGRAARRSGEGVLVEVAAACRGLGLRYRVDRGARAILLEADPLARRPATTSPVDVGHPGPDLELTLLDGKPVRISSFRGQRVLVQAWASW